MVKIERKKARGRQRGAVSLSLVTKVIAGATVLLIVIFNLSLFSKVRNLGTDQQQQVSDKNNENNNNLRRDTPEQRQRRGAAEKAENKKSVAGGELADAASVLKFGGNLDKLSPQHAEPLEKKTGATENRVVVFEVENLGGEKENKGIFMVELWPSAAPLGVKRFEELTEASFWNGCHFFRVIPGFVAQFGINGNPSVQRQWTQKGPIADDRVKNSNQRGTVSFATSGPNARTTQVFINYGNNKGLDNQGFSVIGKVVDGMDVVDKIYGGYGEIESHVWGRTTNEGNAYLDKEMPKLSYIKKAYFR